MGRKKVALLMTVGTGVGENKKKAREGLAHAMIKSMYARNPDIVVFFGSEESKFTLETLKDLYYEENNEIMDFYKFIQIDEIDSFVKYFNKIKSAVNKLEDEYRIVIDYTYGTKTMTMSAAMVSMLFRKELIFVGGERENGIVIPGTEEIQSQNLFPLYDELLLDKIEESFNANRFESAQTLLDDIVYEKNKEVYSNLIKAYSYFDNVNYQEAFKYFDLDAFRKQWPELNDIFIKNRTALFILNREYDDRKEYYLLASLINNARRRYEEGKYDDAIARLYRSLELIGQIYLEKYGLNSSNMDVSILREKGVDDSFIESLESLGKEDGKIKIGLIKDFEVLSYIDEEMGNFYNENKNKIKNIVKFRNSSILAHGMEAKTAKEYEEFKEVLFSVLNILDEDIFRYIEETKFPEFKYKYI